MPLRGIEWEVWNLVMGLMDSAVLESRKLENKRQAELGRALMEGSGEWEELDGTEEDSFKLDIVEILEELDNSSAELDRTKTEPRVY